MKKDTGYKGYFLLSLIIILILFITLMLLVKSRTNLKNENNDLKNKLNEYNSTTTTTQNKSKVVTSKKTTENLAPNEIVKKLWSDYLDTNVKKNIYNNYNITSVEIVSDEDTLNEAKSNHQGLSENAIFAYVTYDYTCANINSCTSFTGTKVENMVNGEQKCLIIDKINNNYKLVAYDTTF